MSNGGTHGSFLQLELPSDPPRRGETTLFPSERAAIVHGHQPEPTEEGRTASLPQTDEPQPAVSNRVTLLRRPVAVDHTFDVLQQWEGTVLRVDDESFEAQLWNKTRIPKPAVPDELAGIPLKEIHEDDRPLIRPGAIFYWAVGYYTQGGTRLRASAIHFRRMPVLDRMRLAAAQQTAKRRREAFGWQT